MLRYTELDWENSDYGVYGYVPSASKNLAALIVFAVAWAAHAVLGVFYRQYWFGTAFFITAGLETGGYIARYLSSQNVMEQMNNFIVQIVLLTIGPAFFMAGIYFLLAEVIVIWGVQRSRLMPWTYSQIFITMDVISLVLQAVGGGMAAVATEDGDDNTTGTHIMVAGLAFQVAATTIFLLLCADYFIRTVNWYRRRNAATSSTDRASISSSSSDDAPAQFAHIRDSRTTHLFLLAILFAVMLVYVRSIYRVAELSQGWSGYLMASEGYFLVLDTLMVAIAMTVSWLFYPAVVLGRVSISKNLNIEKEETADDLEMA
ncbi:RTA1 like protein-domain-containing protein [Myxozyma melibiosi]|uniref:Sphingoid long-chain base transporter RSB1 n=1 Tax=Myxozyma melibiosi TaxID=54550 RepID=A0ABR1F022_9ASCO